MKMVAEWLGVTLDAERGDRQPRVVWRRHKESPSRREDSPDLRQRSRRIGDVLDHLACPHELDGAVLERERTVDRREPKIERGMISARASKRCIRDFDTDRTSSSASKDRREHAAAASEVENALAGPRLGEQQRPPSVEIGGIEISRQSLP